MPSELVGVAGFEPAASSSRRQSDTRIASAGTVCTGWSLSAGVRQCPSKTGCVVTQFVTQGVRSTIVLTIRPVAGGGLDSDVPFSGVADARLSQMCESAWLSPAVSGRWWVPSLPSWLPSGAPADLPLLRRLHGARRVHHPSVSRSSRRVGAA